MLESQRRRRILMTACALALAAAIGMGANSQTPIVDDDFDGFLFDDDWTPTAAIARVAPSGESGFVLTITMQDAALECADATPTPAVRLVLDRVVWRAMGRYSTNDATAVATRDREGARRTQPFVNGGFRLVTRTRTPPEPGQSFVVELDLDDIEASQSYARGQVTVRVCP